MSVKYPHTCITCNKSFSTTGNLLRHVDTAKYCLKLRNELEEKLKYKCNYCEYITSRKDGLIAHIDICGAKKESELKEHEKLKTDLLIMKTKLECATQHNLATIDMLKKEAFKTKVTNNSNNSNNNLTYNTMVNYLKDELSPFEELIPRIQPIIDAKYTNKIMLQELDGAAKFINDEILNTSAGKRYYACTSNNKGTFWYKDDKNDIQPDEGKMIEQHIIPKMANRSSVLHNTESYVFENSMENLEPYTKAYKTIKKLGVNSEPLLKRLSKRCMISSDKMKMDPLHENKEELTPITLEIVDAITAELKTYTPEFLKEMFKPDNFKYVCDFMLDHLDYKYDKHNDVFYYYNDDEKKGTQKVTEKVPDKLYDIYHYKMKQCLRGPLCIYKSSCKMATITTNPENIKILKEIMIIS